MAAINAHGFGLVEVESTNDSMLDHVTGGTEGHINTDEPNTPDYETTFKQPSQDALPEPNAFRASDHNPTIVSPELGTCVGGTNRTPATERDRRLSVGVHGVAHGH